MFQALFLMCATISGDGCVLISSPLYQTEAACLAAFGDGLRFSVNNHPDLMFIEHRCIEWQSSFPNA